MSDSSQSYGDGDSEHEEEHNHHQPSGFSQRFGAMAKFPSALKKVVTRERINSNEEQTEYHHEKSASFGSLFKNRFQPTFNKYMNGTPSSHQTNGNGTTPSPSPGQYSSDHHKKRKKKKKKQHKNSPTPPSHHSHSDSLNNLDSKAFDAIILENRALKNEIEVYKRSIDALSSEKEHICQNYDNLKSKVSDITTQLRIVTRRYNKLKNKNEEYKKHFEHTLNHRLSSQTETIRNYHHQLTQIKEKYDILYGEYLEKNNIIKEWEAKYHRLALDFDEFMNGNAQNDKNKNNQNSKHQPPKPSILIQKCKKLKISSLKKDENLHFLAQIISNLYHNSLPIIQRYTQQQNGTNDDDEDDEDDDEVDSQSTDSCEDSVSEIDGISNTKQQRQNEFDSNLLISTSTPPNSSIDYIEDDESLHPIIYHRKSKHTKQQRQQKNDEKEKEEEELKKYAKNNNLSIPIFESKLNDRSLSGISVDDDGIDERDDDELEKQLKANPIKLTPKNIKIQSKRTRPLSSSSSVASFKQKISDNNSVSTISTGKSMSPPPQTPTNTKKKRRRSWVMEGSNGPIIITTLDGKHSVLQTNEQNKKKEQNKEVKNSKNQSKLNGANSSTETVDIAPSPAPPPPHPNVLQSPNRAQRAASDNGQSQSDENQSASPIISNMSSPSPNPMKNKKNKKNVKPDYSQHDEDEEELNVVIDDECESY